MPISLRLPLHSTAALLLAALPLPATAAPPDEHLPSLFAKVNVTTGAEPRQTLLTGFLSGEAVADLVIVYLNDEAEPMLRVLGHRDGTWEENLEIPLPADVSYVDVANVGGRGRLLTYGRGGLSIFDPVSAVAKRIADVPSDFAPPRRSEIPHVDITRDLNGDGRDDLVLPDAAGFQVLVQTADGEFAPPVKVGTTPDLSGILGADGYRYDPWSRSRVHQADVDLDCRVDLIFWQGDHFEVHLQDERGAFEPGSQVLLSEVGFDSDDPSFPSDGGMVGRALHSLVDLNGDGLAEMIVASLEGSPAAKRRSSYEIHNGQRGPDGHLAFTPTADVVIQSRLRRQHRCCRSSGVQLAMLPKDLDQDGQLDLMFTTIEIGSLSKHPLRSFRGFMGGSLLLDLEFFRMDQGRYPAIPEAARSVKFRFPPNHREPGWVPLGIALLGPTHLDLPDEERARGAFNAPLLLGDISGDGRADLLVGSSRGQLDVYLGVPGPDLFARRPREMELVMAHDGEYTWLTDLNKDGRQDLVMHHASTTEPHRVTLLLGR